MKIKIQKSLIESLISQAIPFTEKKDNTQITSHILIIAEENLIIKATDKEIGISIKSECEIIEKGKATINAKRLNDIIKTLKNKEIEIVKESEQIIISQDESFYKLATFNESEFPTFPDITENQLTNSEEFEEAIKMTFPVIDTNNPKYELNGVLLDISEKTKFVSTDTRRLAIYNSSLSGKPMQIIIPKRAASEIKRIYKKDMKIYYDEINLILENEDVKFFTRLINGKFPAYERIIPKELKYEIEIDKKEFLNHLKQVSIISNEVKIILNREKIEFESISDENTKAKTYFLQNTNLENFIFAVNSKYLIDFINVIEEDKFILGLNEPNIPFVVKSNNFLTIIMPLNI